jgi:ribonuclease R
MENRIGEDFSGIILSCTKYGFFVELDELFIEGLVPISTLGDWGTDERFVFRETDRQIVSTRTGKAFKIGQRVRVLLDRIDRQNKRLQFALLRETAPKQAAKSNSARAEHGTATVPYVPRAKRGHAGGGEGARGRKGRKGKRR